MIDIVLAAYNGERYLAEQIKSIQTNHGYAEYIDRLIVVDDGSSDTTQSIVKTIAANDDKIEWQVNNSLLHGACHNFAFGLSLTTAEYIMLCDQDDIWLPEKIEKSLQEIQSLEKSSSISPCLVFSDQYIVDDDLSLISNSYFTLKNIPHDWYLKIDQLCQQNVASGCTMLFNQALLTKALPIPDKAYMHDWWLVLIASSCGEVKLIDQPLMKYRQHNNNTIGANKVSKWQLFSRFFTHFDQFEHSFNATVFQAQAFKSFLTDNDLPVNNTINALANVQSTAKFKRMKLFLDKRLTRSNILGRLALLLVLLKMKVKTKAQ